LRFRETPLFILGQRMEDEKSNRHPICSVVRLIGCYGNSVPGTSALPFSSKTIPVLFPGLPENYPDLLEKRNRTALDSP
jgi:hypothetical protein